MFWRKKTDTIGQRLDEAGSALIHAARASDEDVEAAASSPLLFSRIRASIGERQEGRWFELFAAARLAIPAMALLAIVATSLPWLAGGSGRSVRARRVRAVAAEPEIVPFAATACALSTAQECAISNNEVLATIFADDIQEIK